MKVFGAVSEVVFVVRGGDGMGPPRLRREGFCLDSGIWILVVVFRRVRAAERM